MGRYADGRVYEGDWKDGKMHDRGVYRYASGAVYEGDYIRTIRGMAEEWVDMLMVMCTKGITRTV